MSNLSENLGVAVLLVGTVVAFDVFQWVWVVLGLLAFTQSFHKRKCGCSFGFKCQHR